MPNEPGNSSFSPKCIYVQPRELVSGGKALDGLGGKKLTNSNQTMNATNLSLRVRLRRISPVVERGIAQTIS